MQPPRIPAIQDAENRLRHEWQEFVTAWQTTAETWKDGRRNQFENDHLKELPGMLSRTTAEIANFRELVYKASRSLADNEPLS